MVSAAAPTLASALGTALVHLREHRVPEPKLEAQLLLAHVLGWPRARVLAHPSDTLRRADGAVFQSLVIRRGRREPYAYLVGTKHWLDLALAVDRNVLIPRPETEILAHIAITAVGRLVQSGRPHPVVVDVGTGSGALALAVARACPSARVLATDSSGAALETAKRNVGLHAPGRVELCQTDLMDDLAVRPDLVIANLPYIPTPDLAGLAPELAFEPRSALDGGGDGLGAIRSLLAQACIMLPPHGELLLECGHDQARLIVDDARLQWPGSQGSILPDLAGFDRFVHLQVSRT